MSLTDLTNWLKERTELSLLDEEILNQIVPHLQHFSLPKNETLVTEKESVKGLYILRSGHLERLSQKVSLLPGAAINLGALILEQAVRETVVSSSDCEFWFLEASIFQELVKQYPQIIQAFSQYLASEVQVLSSQLVFEQERQTILRPYLVPKARRAIMGSSRYAEKLRSQIQDAFDSREAVLIFGEPGLERVIN